MSLQKKIVSCCVGVILSCCLATPLWAVDAQKLIAETQHVDQSEGKFNLVWWIPNEFWAAQGMQDADVASLLTAIGDYCVVCVVDAEMTPLGSVIPVSRANLMTKLSLNLPDGTVLKPLPDTDISSDALNLFAMMKPVMGNMLGQFGSGMEFVCFKGLDTSGKRYPDPLQADSFSLSVGTQGFPFKLPLGSLLPVKMDPVSSEEFPGTYMYNPYTGQKLILK